MSLEGITAKLVVATTQALINKLFKEVYAMVAFFATAGITFILAFFLIKGVSVWSLLLLAFVSGIVASISVAVALHFKTKEWKAKTKELETRVEEWKTKAEEWKRKADEVEEKLRSDVQEKLKSDICEKAMLAQELMDRIKIMGISVGVVQTKSLGLVEVYKLSNIRYNLTEYFIVPVEEVNPEKYLNILRLVSNHTLNKSEGEAIRIIEKL